MAEPLSHVLRARLPWRGPEDDMTECGRAANDVAATVTVDAARDLVAKHGAQRASFLLCMTCANHIRPPWEQDPIGVLARHCEMAAWSRSSPELTDRLTRELRAVEAIIAAHRDEFDAYVNGLAVAPSLAARRAAGRKGTLGLRPL